MRVFAEGNGEKVTFSYSKRNKKLFFERRVTLSRSIPAASRYGTCSARFCADHCGNVGL